MPYAFALSLTRPHETFHFSMPLGRRLPRGLCGWNLVLLGLTIMLGLVYVVLVNTASSKNAMYRNVEKRVETLKNETTILQDSILALSSLQALDGRARELGFVPVDRLEFVNPAANAFAMK